MLSRLNIINFQITFFQVLLLFGFVKQSSNWSEGKYIENDKRSVKSGHVWCLLICVGIEYFLCCENGRSRKNIMKKTIK